MSHAESVQISQAPQIDSLDQLIKRNRKTVMAVAAILFVVLYFVYAPAKEWMRMRQIHAMQIGVKGDLRMLLDKQQAFRQKFGFYTTDLKALGIAPKAVVYKFGFVSPSWVTAPGLEPARKDLDALKASDPMVKIEYSPVTKLDKIEFDRLVSYCPDCTADRHSFKAVAAANLDEDAVLDVWTIDEKGEIAHLIDDL